ncbi:tripartite tricarboxylate transporter substrate binding protein [Roseococcus sp. SYP-B2431]|uniref:Bug family tripartite tricarboxylate transporter substrate binding protein n=1 Tax=Roseococcus sp. SYP-B2431 TaxID=2496640 RepID=UPI001039F456|nr:tripartite tricarboxylate transporter substrate binding protein [Roseococcus sp. SYP-B2431]TCI00975.1 tripartite tricarboxylate transporter substrate binding protein [Roseococcus sp. SYP-B2431]
MPSSRRGLTRAAAAMAAWGLAAPGARAADPWPSRTLRILTPFGAGGAMDMVARLLAPAVSQALGQPVVVENRPGATGTVCMGEVAQAAPDGHTMMITGSSFAIVGLLMPNLRFRMGDFAPLTRLTVGPSVLVVPAQLGLRSFPEFVAAAKARPGQWSYGSVGVGTSLHLGGEELKMLTGTDLVHVPYRGWTNAATDLLANRIQVYFSTIPDALPMIQSGQLRALAVTHSERLPALPETPTVTELGFPKLRVSSDFGMAIGAGVPAAIRARLEEVFRAAIREPAIQARLLTSGIFVVGSSAEEYASLLAEDIARYAEIIRVAGIRLE